MGREMKPEELGLTVEVETITPAMAKQYLSHNAYHRKVKKKKVNEYVLTLQAGQWRLNGKTITFDSNGRLLGGQHRLHAVVESGISLLTLVVRGLDPALLETNEENNEVVH